MPKEDQEKYLNQLRFHHFQRVDLASQRKESKPLLTEPQRDELKKRIEKNSCNGIINP